jgi:hypothetical protein
MGQIMSQVTAFSRPTTIEEYWRQLTVRLKRECDAQGFLYDGSTTNEVIITTRYSRWVKIRICPSAQYRQLEYHSDDSAPVESQFKFDQDAGVATFRCEPGTDYNPEFLAKKILRLLNPVAG